MPASAPSDARVLIAGAGPVGMAVALELAHAGIAATVLERADELSEDLRASTWHPPTLDMLDAIDPSLTPALKAQGLVARHTAYRDRRAGLFAEFDMELLRGETAHPYRVQSEQYKFTRLVAERLQAFPHVTVRFGCKVDAVEQSADRVTVESETRGGRETFSGAYLVGADGAWSAVRQAIGVEFEGFTYPERFYVASTAFDFAQRLERLAYVNYVSDPDEWCVLLRTPTCGACVSDARGRARRGRRVRRLDRGAAAGRLRTVGGLRDRPPHDLPRSPARGQALPRRQGVPRGRHRAHQQSARRDGHERRPARRRQPRRQAREGIAGRGGGGRSSISTSGSGARSRSTTSTPTPRATRSCWKSAIRRCARAARRRCVAPPRTPPRRARSCSGLR